jgi:hypothetical protein
MIIPSFDTLTIHDIGHDDLTQDTTLDGPQALESTNESQQLRTSRVLAQVWRESSHLVCKAAWYENWLQTGSIGHTKLIVIHVEVDHQGTVLYVKQM